MKYDISKVTPRPWASFVSGSKGAISGRAGVVVGKTDRFTDTLHIVHCVNHHEELVAMVEFLHVRLNMDFTGEEEWRNSARALLEKVKV